MDEDKQPTDLVERWRHGDQEAAKVLFARYARRLTRLAEQHLNQRLAGRVDGEDVVQSVFRTFFRRSAEGKFRIDSSTGLWRLLVKITILKTRDEVRRHTAACRSVDQQAGLERGDGWLIEAVANHPGPVEAAILIEQVGQLLEGLPALYCRMLELRLAGYTVAETAQELDVSRQTIYRALNLLQERLMSHVPEANRPRGE